MEIRRMINSFSFSRSTDGSIAALLTKTGRGPAVTEAEEPAHRDRFPFVRPFHYSSSLQIEENGCPEHPLGVEDFEGTGLALNLSSHGMLVVLEDMPRVEQVFTVRIPTPIEGVHTPTLAEVRWTRELLLSASDRLHLVGLKFLV